MSKADFELTFFADGHVELTNDADELVWSSDDDDEFINEFGREFFSDEEDSDDILDYLEECGHVDLENHDIDCIENDLEDETDDEADDILEAEFTEVARREPMPRKKRSFQ